MDNHPAIECPVPLPPGDRVMLAHGEGTRLSRRLFRDLLLPAFDNEHLRAMSDAAILPDLGGRPVFTTDSYVVSPLFFPGGNIGRLAVHGTVNDLAVSGAIPLYLTLGLIIEEGLPFDMLRRVVESIADAARQAGVAVVAGDTKVVPRGAADQLFINVTGLGRLRERIDWGHHKVRPGDAVLVSGNVGDHGLTILSERAGLGLQELHSDCASVFGLVERLVAATIDVRFLRDPTRGGVGAVLHELAEGACLSVELEEATIPLSPACRGACEILGIDPLFSANEGKLVAVVGPKHVDAALRALREDPLGRDAAVIGKVIEKAGEPVLVRNPFGVRRVLDEPSGALLPRIC